MIAVNCLYNENVPTYFLNPWQLGKILPSVKCKLQTIVEIGSVMKEQHLHLQSSYPLIITLYSIKHKEEGIFEDTKGFIGKILVTVSLNAVKLETVE